MSNIVSLRSRTLVVVLAATLTVAVAALVWAFVDADAPTSGVAASADRDVTLAQDGSNDTGEGIEEDQLAELDTIEVTYDVFVARDPFESIRPPEPASSGDGSGNGSTGNGSSGDGTNGGSSGGGSTNGGSTNGGGSGNGGTGKEGEACRTGTEAVCEGTVIVLKSIVGGSAEIEIDGVTYAVAPGGSFGGNFQLLAIAGECVEILYMNGDEADVFQLCIGGSVAK